MACVWLPCPSSFTQAVGLLHLRVPGDGEDELGGPAWWPGGSGEPMRWPETEEKAATLGGGCETAEQIHGGRPLRIVIFLSDAASPAPLLRAAATPPLVPILAGRGRHCRARSPSSRPRRPPLCPQHKSVHGWPKQASRGLAQMAEIGLAKKERSISAFSYS
ncbi:hypothetical protein BS78_03G008100 [Paspalum vaginatum]|nr:hypothetical protein BS78_03G008100 [Paspalum vaginatum]